MAIYHDSTDGLLKPEDGILLIIVFTILTLFSVAILGAWGHGEKANDCWAKGGELIRSGKHGHVCIRRDAVLDY